MKRIIILLLIMASGCESRFLPPISAPIRSAKLNMIVESAAQRYFVPAGLIHAVITAESAGNAGAISSAGAQGLMQLMPGTALACGVTDVFDPSENVDCGTRYLHLQLERYRGNVRLALSAYNAGPGAVDKYRAVPPYAETQAYVARVLSLYQRVAKATVHLPPRTLTRPAAFHHGATSK